MIQNQSTELIAHVAFQEGKRTLFHITVVAYPTRPAAVESVSFVKLSREDRISSRPFLAIGFPQMR